MKQHIIYECETCGYKSENLNKIKKHEAAHFGLSVKEMEEYERLKSFAEYMGYVVSNHKNEETDKEFDDAISALLEFEKEHGIKPE